MITFVFRTATECTIAIARKRLPGRESPKVKTCVGPRGGRRCPGAKPRPNELRVLCTRFWQREGATDVARAEQTATS